MDAVIVRNLTRSEAGLTRSADHLALQALTRMGAVPAGSGSEMQPQSAVWNISLRVREGEIFGIQGPHNAGKTTLLRLITGDLRPDSGSVQVFGWDTVQQAAQVARLVSPVRMDDGLFDRLSPLDNLVYSARLAGAYAREPCLDSRTLLLMLGLESSALNSPLAELPLAARRKVALARILQSPARLLLLDDPFADLDACDRQKARFAVQECHRQSGRTIILATRDPADGLVICDRVAVLDRGRLVGLGASTDVLPVGISVPQDCFNLAA